MQKPPSAIGFIRAIKGNSHVDFTDISGRVTRYNYDGGVNPIDSLEVAHFIGYSKQALLIIYGDLNDLKYLSTGKFNQNELRLILKMFDINQP